MFTRSACKAAKFIYNPDTFYFMMNKELELYETLQDADEPLPTNSQPQAKVTNTELNTTLQTVFKLVTKNKTSITTLTRDVRKLQVDLTDIKDITNYYYAHLYSAY